MKKKDAYAILDIGTKKICVIIASLLPNGKLKILGQGQAKSAGITSGIISDIYKAKECIQKAIKNAQSDAQMNISTLLVGISGDYIKHLNIEGSITISNYGEAEIKEKDIKDVIANAKNKAKQDVNDTNLSIIHAIARNYTIDNESANIDNPIGKYGCYLSSNVHIIFAKRSNLRDVNKCLELAGYSVEGFVYNGLASSGAILEREQKKYGVIMLDIGAGTTDITVFSAGSICYTKVIPMGGDSITEVLAIGLNTKAKIAEKLKTDNLDKQETFDIMEINGERTRTVETKKIRAIINYHVKELVNDIHSNFVDSDLLKKISVGIVLSGGSSNLKIIKDYLDSTFDMFVSIRKPFLGFLEGEKITRLQSCNYSSGVGLLYYYLKMNKNFNSSKKFLREDFLAKIKRFFKDFV